MDLRFGPFRFHQDPPELEREGEPVHLRPQAVELLALLLERPGRLVTREAIRDRIWGDTVVEYDQGIHALVREVRDVLGDDADDPRWVETVPRRGYRFVGPVREGDEVAFGPEGGGADAPDTGDAPNAAEGDGGAREIRFSLVFFLLVAVLGAVAIPRLWTGGFFGRPSEAAVTVPPLLASATLEPTAPATRTALVERLAETEGIEVVPWNLGDPEGAELALEATLEPTEGAGADAPHRLMLRLYRWPERSWVWDGTVTGEAGADLGVRAADVLVRVLRTAR